MLKLFLSLQSKTLPLSWVHLRTNFSGIIPNTERWYYIFFANQSGYPAFCLVFVAQCCVFRVAVMEFEPLHFFRESFGIARIALYAKIAGFMRGSPSQRDKLGYAELLHAHIFVSVNLLIT